MKIKLTLIQLLFGSIIFCQQDSQFTQFWNAQNYFNPATSGLEFKHQATVLARFQWIGVNGAPDTQLATYSAKIKKIHGGIGAGYEHQKIGFSNENIAKLNYSYQMKFKNETTLALGVSGGIVNYSSNPEWVVPITFPDPYLPMSLSGTKFNSDFGVAYLTKKLNVGMSVSHLNAPRIYQTNGTSMQTFQYARHYYLYGSYIFGDENRLQMKPQILVKTDLVKVSLDLNMLFFYKSKYWIGLSYRTEDAICFSAGLNFLKKFNFGYSYDLTINALNKLSKGSHEFVLGMRIK